MFCVAVLLLRTGFSLPLESGWKWLRLGVCHFVTVPVSPFQFFSPFLYHLSITRWWWNAPGGPGLFVNFLDTLCITWLSGHKMKQIHVGKNHLLHPTSRRWAEVQIPDEPVTVTRTFFGGFWTGDQWRIVAPPTPVQIPLWERLLADIVP